MAFMQVGRLWMSAMVDETYDAKRQVHARYRAYRKTE